MKKILIVAVSLDGYIAQSREQVSTAWTSNADKKHFVQLTKEIGTMLMGRPTYETIGKPLPGRKIVVLSSQEVAGAQALTDFSPTTDGSLYQSGGLPLATVLQTLAAKGLTQVAICGGARVYQQFLLAGLVDELYLTIEPVFLGDGIRLLDVPMEELTTGQWPLKLELIERIPLDNQTTVFHLARH